MPDASEAQTDEDDILWSPEDGRTVVWYVSKEGVSRAAFAFKGCPVVILERGGLYCILPAWLEAPPGSSVIYQIGVNNEPT